MTEKFDHSKEAVNHRDRQSNGQ